MPKYRREWKTRLGVWLPRIGIVMILIFSIYHIYWLWLHMLNPAAADDAIVVEFWLKYKHLRSPGFPWEKFITPLSLNGLENVRHFCTAWIIGLSLVLTGVVLHRKAFSPLFIFLQVILLILIIIAVQIYSAMAYDSYLSVFSLYV